MPDLALSSQQLAVICALSSGLTSTAAGEQAGVHRNTIANWCRNSLLFQEALSDAQYDRALLFRERIEDLLDLAIQSLQQILTDPKSPPSVRLKAALAIINSAATPPDPKKHIEIDIQKVVGTRPPQPPAAPKRMHNDAQPAPPEPQEPVAPVNQPTPAVQMPAPLHNPPQSPAAQPNGTPAPDSTPTAAHKSAQTASPKPIHIRRPIARNAQCPCGSGKKYKRCCFDLAA